jgi:hypothetical protein
MWFIALLASVGFVLLVLVIVALAIVIRNRRRSKRDEGHELGEVGHSMKPEDRQLMERPQQAPTLLSNIIIGEKIGAGASLYLLLRIAV